MPTKYKATRNTCCVGYISCAIVTNITPIFFVVFQDKYGLSYQQLALLVVLNFATQLSVDLLSLKYVDRIGYRVAAVLASSLCALGLLLMGILPNILPNIKLALVFSTICASIGGGLFEVILSPIIDTFPVPDEKRSTTMSILHSFYSWGMVGAILFTTILIKLIGNDKWYIIPIMWAIVPFINIFNFVKMPMIKPSETTKIVGIKPLIKSNMFLIFLLIMFCAGACEQIIAQWASIFAEKGLGVSKILGDIIGPCLFALTMGIGRLLYGLWGYKLDLYKVMILSSILCSLCYLTAALASYPIINLLACSICGFAVCLMWPGTISMAISKFPLAGSALFASFAVCGDLGCSIGPWIVGGIADNAQKSGVFFTLNNLIMDGKSGLYLGILFGSMFPLILAITLIKSHKLYRNIDCDDLL